MTGRNISKRFLFLGVVIFIFIVFFGLPSLMSISESNMSDCPFTVGVLICNMTALLHIEMWQQIFLNLPATFFGITLLVFASGHFFVVQANRKIISPHPDNSYKKFAKANPSDYPDDPFSELFSNGILNPKLYN